MSIRQTYNSNKNQYTIILAIAFSVLKKITHTPGKVQSDACIYTTLHAVYLTPCPPVIVNGTGQLAVSDVVYFHFGEGSYSKLLD